MGIRLWASFRGGELVSPGVVRGCERGGEGVPIVAGCETAVAWGVSDWRDRTYTATWLGGGVDGGAMVGDLGHWLHSGGGEGRGAGGEAGRGKWVEVLFCQGFGSCAVMVMENVLVACGLQ